SRRSHAIGFRIIVNMTDGDVVERAARIAGVGYLRGPVSPKNPRHLPYWRWSVDDRASIYALGAAILPFMGDRRSARICEQMKVIAVTGRAAWEHATRYGYERGCRCYG